MDDFLIWLKALILAVFTGIIAVAGFGCSSSEDPITVRDVAALASVAGATNADAHLQFQNRPTSVGMQQAFYLDTGADVAMALTFDGADVDQEALFQLMEELEVDPATVTTNGV